MRQKSSVLRRGRRQFAGFALGCIALLAGCATTPTPVSVADTVARRPELSTLSQLLTTAGLAEALKTGGPFTLFAPSNDAFKAVPQKTMDELARDPARLKAVLGYHAVAQRLNSESVLNGNIKTLNGANLALGKAGTFVTVEDAMVQTADIQASNGVVHVVDRVLMPPRN